jgi:hypothetical protein
MYDLDELDLRIDTTAVSNVSSPSQQQLEERPRRDSVISDVSVGPRHAKVEKLEGSDTQKHELSIEQELAPYQKMQDTEREADQLQPHGRLNRRRHVRTSSDPGEPAPLVLKRTRPSNILTRAATTGNLESARVSSTASNNSSTLVHRSTPAYSNIDSIDHDLARHEVTLQAINHDKSPLERLVDDAEQLNLYDDMQSTRQASCEVVRFPSFETSHSRSTSIAMSVSSHDFVHAVESSSVAEHSNARQPPNLAATPERSRGDIPLTTSPIGSSPSTPIGRQRLRALAATFNSVQLFSRSPVTALREDDNSSAQHQVVHIQPPTWTLTPLPSQLPPLMPLRGSAVVSGGRPLTASPMFAEHPTTMSRSRAREERENDDDTSQVEEEARFWRERVEIANNRHGAVDRTPPSQGRFLRFLDSRR